MNFFKINEDPLQVDAQHYNELEELALECNFLKGSTEHDDERQRIEKFSLRYKVNDT